MNNLRDDTVFEKSEKCVTTLLLLRMKFVTEVGLAVFCLCFYCSSAVSSKEVCFF